MNNNRSPTIEKRMNGPPPKKWSVQEEQEMIHHLQQTHGDIEKVARALGRSARAIDMRITRVLQTMKRTKNTSVPDLHRIVGGSLSEQEITNRLAVNMDAWNQQPQKTSSSSTELREGGNHNHSSALILRYLTSIEEMLHDMNNRLGVMEKALVKKKHKTKIKTEK